MIVSSFNLLQGGLQISSNLEPHCRINGESQKVCAVSSSNIIICTVQQPVSKQKLELQYKTKAESVKKKEHKDDSHQTIDLDNNNVLQSAVTVAHDATQETP